MSWIKSVGRYVVHSSLRKNVEPNLVGVLVWTEVGVQVRTNAVAHLHRGHLYASVTTGPPVCASVPHACKTRIFWIVILIRAMTSCLLVLVCDCVAWRNCSFHLASYCFQRQSWNSEFLRSTLTTITWPWYPDLIFRKRVQTPACFILSILQWADPFLKTNLGPSPVVRSYAYQSMLGVPVRLWRLHHLQTCFLRGQAASPATGSASCIFATAENGLLISVMWASNREGTDKGFWLLRQKDGTYTYTALGLVRAEQESFLGAVEWGVHWGSWGAVLLLLQFN